MSVDLQIVLAFVAFLAVGTFYMAAVDLVPDLWADFTAWVGARIDALKEWNANR